MISLVAWWLTLVVISLLHLVIISKCSIFTKVHNPHEKSNRNFFFLCIPKDLANRCTNMVLHYSVASNRSMEGFYLTSIKKQLISIFNNFWRKWCNSVTLTSSMKTAVLPPYPFHCLSFILPLFFEPPWRARGLSGLQEWGIGRKTKVPLNSYFKNFTFHCFYALEGKSIVDFFKNYCPLSSMKTFTIFCKHCRIFSFLSE